MDYDLLQRFHPRIFDIVIRDKAFWRAFDYRLIRKPTKLYILAYAYEGLGTLTVDGVHMELAAGSLFQIKPGVHMDFTSHREEPLCFYSIQYQGYMVDENEACLLPLKGTLPLPDHSVYQEAEVIHRACRLMWEDWNGKRPGYEWRCKLAMLSLVNEIAALESLKESDGSMRGVIDRVVEYINANYMASMDRNALAAYANLSPGYFSTAFKAQTGDSPVQYINKVRIDRAKQLLRSTTLPIAEISSAVGFEDSFYFARQFSKATGFSPRDYRKA